MGLGFWRVQRMLGDNHLSEGNLCTSPKIRKWSREKPTDFPGDAPYNNAEWIHGNRDPYNGGNPFLRGAMLPLYANGVGVSVGTTDLSNANGTSFLHKLAHGHGEWVYEKQKLNPARNQQYRILDFSNYQPLAINPLPQPVGGTLTYTSSSVNMAINFPEQVVGGHTLASLGLTEMYVGVLLYDNEYKNAIWVTDTMKISTALLQPAGKGKAITLNLTGKRGLYRARTFLSSQQILQNEVPESKVAMAGDPLLELLSCDGEEVLMGVREYRADGKYLRVENISASCKKVGSNWNLSVSYTPINDTELQKVITEVSVIQTALGGDTVYKATPNVNLGAFGGGSQLTQGVYTGSMQIVSTGVTTKVRIVISGDVFEQTVTIG